MIVLHFSMQGEDIYEHTNDICHVLHFGMQEDDTLEHTNGKRHLCTLYSTCNIGMHLIALLNILTPRY